jgi:hypothetical protein
MPNYDSTTNTMLNTQRATENLTEKGYQNDLSKISNSNTNGLLQTSTNIFIRANNKNIGMIQSFNVSESRTVTKLQSIGIEGVTQAAPQNTKGGSISAQRVALYGERIYDAFKIDTVAPMFKTLKDQRIPFEIQVLTVNGQKSDGSASYYVETYVDCWLSSYKKSYTVSNVTVSEDVSIAYADVI